MADHLVPILDRYRLARTNGTPGQETELEIRTSLGYSTWATAYETTLAQSTGATIEQSAVFLVNPKQNPFHRKELYFTNGVQDPKRAKCTAKESLKHASIDCFRIVLAQETPLTSMDLNAATQARLRLRIGLIVAALPHWRLDFTATHTISGTTSINHGIKAARERLFPTGKVLTPKNLLAHLDGLARDPLPKGQEYVWELECEYAGGDRPATIEDVQAVVAFLSGLIKTSPAPAASTAATANVYTATIAEICRLLSRPVVSTLKQVANQPLDFTSTDLPGLQVKFAAGQYWVTDKADGERGWLYGTPDAGWQVILGKHQIPFEGPAPKAVELYDCEAVTDKNKLYLHLFDVIVWGGEPIYQMPFSKREVHLDKAAAKIGKRTVSRKPQTHMRGPKYGQQISEMYNRETRLYEIDGLIFTEDAPYFTGHVWKWKPPHKLTTDFLVLPVPERLAKLKPFAQDSGAVPLILTVGANRSVVAKTQLPSYYNELVANIKCTPSYSPIPFMPEGQESVALYHHPADHKVQLSELVGQVAEFSRPQGQWLLERVRSDKEGTLGNDYSTAERLYYLAQRPITLADLTGATTTITGSADSYFAEAKAPEYGPITKLHGFIKAQIMRQVEQSSWIIDLACGKGQDLFIYNGYRVHNGLFIDQDEAALAELNSRRPLLGKRELYLYSPMPQKPMSIHTLRLDLRQPASVTYEAIAAMNLLPLREPSPEEEPAAKSKTKSKTKVPVTNTGVNAVVINFALHYLVRDQSSLANLIELVSKLLAPGGVLVFTAFDGRRVYDLLEGTSTGASMDLKVGDTVRYSIRKDYPDDAEFQPFGMKIGVKHPFSGDKYYPENLVGIRQVVQEFEAQGYQLRQNASFSNWVDRFRQWNPQVAANLTPVDELYSCLYSYVSLWRPVR